MFKRVGPVFKVFAEIVAINGSTVSLIIGIYKMFSSRFDVGLAILVGGMIGSIVVGVILAAIGSIVEAAEKYLDSNNVNHKPDIKESDRAESKKSIEEDIASVMQDL